MMEYELIIASHPENLERSVNRQIEKGWKPLGGPFVDSGSCFRRGSIAQAMTKAEPPQESE